MTSPEIEELIERLRAPSYKTLRSDFPAVLDDRNAVTMREAAQALQALKEERDELKQLQRSADLDAERACERASKLELDLKCLQESTVDVKAYDALKDRNEKLEEALEAIEKDGTEEHNAAIKLRSEVVRLRAALQRIVDPGVYNETETRNDCRYFARQALQVGGE